MRSATGLVLTRQQERDLLLPVECADCVKLLSWRLMPVNLKYQGSRRFRSHHLCGANQVDHLHEEWRTLMEIALAKCEIILDSEG